MQNEKSNNKHWKEKLEEAGSFPYHPAGKELAWQKLSGRLGEKKRRKKAVWYWAAAACLLPLIGLMVFTFTQTHQRGFVVKMPPKKSTIAIPSVDTPRKQTETETITITRQPVVRKIDLPKAKPAEIAIKADDKKEIPSVDSNTTNNIATVVVPSDTATNIAAIVPTQKKKLKVVHINELDEPYESLPAMAHNTYYPKFLPLQIACETIYPEPAKTITSTGFINLKSKSSN